MICGLPYRYDHTSVMSALFIGQSLHLLKSIFHQLYASKCCPGQAISESLAGVIYRDGRKSNAFAESIQSSLPRNEGPLKSLCFSHPLAHRRQCVYSSTHEQMKSCRRRICSECSASPCSLPHSVKASLSLSPSGPGRVGSGGSSPTSKTGYCGAVPVEDMQALAITSLSAADVAKQYEHIRELGKGTYGKVDLVAHRTQGQ